MPDIILKIEELGIYLLMGLLIWQYINKQLEKKILMGGNWFNQGIRISEVIVITLLMNFMNNHGVWIKFALLFIYIYGWTIVFNKGNLVVKLFIVITTLLIVGIGDVIGIVAVIESNQYMTIIDLKEDGKIRVFALLMGVLAIGVIVNVLIRYKSFKIDKLKKSENVILILPAIVNVITLLMILRSKNSISLMCMKSLKMLGGLIINIIVLGTVNIYLFEKLLQGVSKKKENDVMRQQMDLQYEYYRSTQKQYIESRKLWHDMKNHLMCIDNLIKKDNYNDAKTYLVEVTEIVEELSDTVKTGSNILDIIINQKVIEAKKNKIDMSIKINFPENVKMEFVDICTIYGNALDNAIEGCKNIADEKIKRRIGIKTTLVNSFLVIKITNTFSGKIKLENNQIITTKQDKNCHGIGLKNIQYVVDKYEGEFKIEYSDTEFRLAIMIPSVVQEPKCL